MGYTSLLFTYFTYLLYCNTLLQSVGAGQIKTNKKNTKEIKVKCKLFASIKQIELNINWASLQFYIGISESSIYVSSHWASFSC